MGSKIQLLTSSGLRIDSRLPLELRALSFSILPDPSQIAASSSSSSTSAIAPAHPDGYATVSHGLTRVSSSVYGPREPSRTGAFSSGQAGAAGSSSNEKAQVNVEVGTSAWSERVSMNGQSGGLRKAARDRRTVELAASLKATFEPVILLHLYPRSAIDIYIQILETDGSALQAAVNATTLALISAGIPLTDYVCAVSLASYPAIPASAPAQIPPFELVAPVVAHSNTDDGARGSGSTTLLDCCQEEERALPTLTVAVLPKSEKVTLISLETRVGIGRFEEMLRWGIEAGKAIQGAMEEAVRDWSESIAASSKDMASLFPGTGSLNSRRDADDVDMQ